MLSFDDLTTLRQDGSPVDDHILKVNRSRFHDNPMTSHQGTPSQHEVTRRGVENTSINAVFS